jgi:glycosyl transferase family 28
VIGWYVHHQGSGHLQQLRLVSEHLRSPVTGLSSLERPQWWEGGWIDLPHDDGGHIHDATAGGVLHWAPRLHDGLRRRNALIARWIDRARPALMVVDVSAEVALLSRILGIPVVVAAMRGDRRDRAHTTAYDLADALLAPWPAKHCPAAWPKSWTAKTWHVGAFSRFDKVTRPAGQPDGQRRVLLLAGDGGIDIGPADVEDARVATRRDWSWTVAGVGSRLRDDEVWPALCAADVVLAHAGQSVVAEVAAARRPAIVFAQRRPHDEQLDTAETLHRAGIAIGLDRWPRSRALPMLLESALTQNPAKWGEWSPGDGAERAARHLDGLANDLESARCVPH